MLLSKEQLDASSQIHPDVAEASSHLDGSLINRSTNPPQFLKNMPPPDFSDPVAFREGLRIMTDAVADRLGPPPKATTELFHTITLRDGPSSSLKIHKPEHDARGPLIVLIFGGGFVAGNNSQMTPTARALVGLFQATVVNISYRLSPEFKFPQGQLDAIDSVKWIAENATGDILASDPSKGFILGGVSVGAGITAVLSRWFQKDPLAHPLTGQWLNIPLTMTLTSCPEKYRDHYISISQNAQAPMLPKVAMDMMAEASSIDPSSDLAYAANSSTPLSGQPKTYIGVSGMDPLRDDGLIYHEMLKEAGVETRIDFYPGCPHGHSMLMAGTPLGNEGNMNTLKGIGWLLGRDVSQEMAAMAIGLKPE